MGDAPRRRITMEPLDRDEMIVAEKLAWAEKQFQRHPPRPGLRIYTMDSSRARDVSTHQFMDLLNSRSIPRNIVTRVSAGGSKLMEYYTFAYYQNEIRRKFNPNLDARVRRRLRFLTRSFQYLYGHVFDPEYGEDVKLLYPIALRNGISDADYRYFVEESIEIRYIYKSSHNNSRQIGLNLEEIERMRISLGINVQKIHDNDTYIFTKNLLDRAVPIDQIRVYLAEVEDQGRDLYLPALPADFEPEPGDREELKQFQQIASRAKVVVKSASPLEEEGEPKKTPQSSIEEGLDGEEDEREEDSEDEEYTYDLDEREKPEESEEEYTYDLDAGDESEESDEEYNYVDAGDEEYN